MFVESFHRTLKEVYLERKQNKRIDHLLSTLRKIARDKAYEQWIKAEKGKVTIRQRESTKRHKQAESMPSELVSRQDAESWQVQSMTDKTKIYYVRRADSSLCKCLLRCSLCAACVHSFTCTCLDYAIRGVVCVHIHAVNIAEPTEDPRDIASNEIDDKREELGNFIQVDKDLKNDKELEDLKRSALAAMAELTDVIQTAPSKDTVYTALRHIRSATAVAKGLSIIGNDHQYLKTKSFPLNKKAEKQPRFFSTKRKARMLFFLTLQLKNCKKLNRMFVLSALRKTHHALRRIPLTGMARFQGQN